MKRRYIVQRVPSIYSSCPDRWIVVPKWDQCRVIDMYVNLWDAGAKAAKLNAREDQLA